MITTKKMQKEKKIFFYQSCLIKEFFPHESTNLSGAMVYVNLADLDIGKRIDLAMKWFTMFAALLHWLY